MLEATGEAREPLVLRPRRPPDRGGEGLPLSLGAARDHDPLVVAGSAVRALRGTAPAVARREVGPPRRAAVHRPVEQERARQSRGGLELRDVDVLSFPRPAPVGEGHQGAHRAQVAADVVQVAERPPRRLPSGQPHQMGEPGERLRGRPHRHVVGVGTGVAVAAHRHVDHVGAQLAQRVVADAPPRHRPGCEALRHDVADGDQPPEQAQALRVAGVHRDAALSPGVVLVEDAPAVVAAGLLGVGQGRTTEAFPDLAGVGHERRHHPDRVRPGRALDADHLRTEAAEDQRGLGPEPEPAEVEHPQALERHRSRPVHHERRILP